MFLFSFSTFIQHFIGRVIVDCWRDGHAEAEDRETEQERGRENPKIQHYWTAGGHTRKICEMKEKCEANTFAELPTRCKIKYWFWMLRNDNKHKIVYAYTPPLPPLPCCMERDARIFRYSAARTCSHQWRVSAPPRVWKNFAHVCVFSFRTNYLPKMTSNAFEARERGKKLDKWLSIKSTACWPKNRRITASAVCATTNWPSWWKVRRKSARVHLAICVLCAAIGEHGEKYLTRWYLPDDGSAHWWDDVEEKRKNATYKSGIHCLTQDFSQTENSHSSHTYATGHKKHDQKLLRIHYSLFFIIIFVCVGGKRIFHADAWLGQNIGPRIPCTRTVHADERKSKICDKETSRKKNLKMKWENKMRRMEGEQCGQSEKKIILMPIERGPGAQIR